MIKPKSSFIFSSPFIISLIETVETCSAHSLGIRLKIVLISAIESMIAGVSNPILSLESEISFEIDFP